MNRRDIRKGMTVYHSLYTHWGRGIVQGIDAPNYGEILFERGGIRVLVAFEGSRSAVSRMRLRELRKTPNRKKLKAMIELYRTRGVDARDGGDRLILPLGATRT